MTDSSLKDVSLDDEICISEKPKLAFSQWRKKQIGSDFNQQPGLDDLRKIKSKIKSKNHDHLIMEIFGINCETLAAIKSDNYCPATGISMDNMSKIYFEFERVEKRIMRMMNGLNYMASILFIGKDELKEFKKECNKSINLRKNRDAIYDFYDGIDDEMDL